MPREIVEPDYSVIARRKAENKAVKGQQFETDTVQRYQAQYRHYWDLDHDLTAEQRQEIMDQNVSITVGGAAAVLAELTRAKIYAETIGNADHYDNPLPALYLSAPFELDWTTEPGRILVGAMKQAWIDELAEDDEV